MECHIKQNKNAKPFVKWDGEKTQLLNEIGEAVPDNIEQTQFTYIKPFVGGGTVLFWMLQKYSNIEKVIINDINTDLINSYKIIKENVEDLIRNSIVKHCTVITYPPVKT